MNMMEVVSKNTLPGASNVLWTRFPLALKNRGTLQERAKARMVVKGHTDRDRYNVVHDSKNLHRGSIKVIVSIAAINGCTI